MYYILKTTLQVINDKDTNIENSVLAVFDRIETEKSTITSEMLEPNLAHFDSANLEDWQTHGNNIVYVDVFSHAMTPELGSKDFFREKFQHQLQHAEDWIDSKDFDRHHDMLRLNWFSGGVWVDNSFGHQASYRVETKYKFVATKRMVHQIEDN